jgi:putative transposase
LVHFFLAERKAFYEAHTTEKVKGLNDNDNDNDNANALKSMKKDPECLAENRAFTGAIQQSLKDLDKATQNFFAKRAKFPKFHKKSARQSLRTMGDVFVGDGWIDFPKIGKVKTIIHRPCEGKCKKRDRDKNQVGSLFCQRAGGSEHS